MSKLVTKILSFCFKQFFSEFDPSVVVPKPCDKNGLQWQFPKINLKLDRLKTLNLPFEAKSGKIEKLQISVFGEHLSKIKVDIRINLLELELTQLPNAQWQKKIQQAVSNDLKNEIKDYCWDILKQKFPDGVKGLYRKFLLKILDNIIVNIDKVRVTFKKENQCSPQFQIILDTVTTTHSASIKKQTELRHFFGDVVRTTQIKEIQINSISKASKKNPNNLLSLKNVKVERLPQKSFKFDIKLHLPTVIFTATPTLLQHIASILKKTQEFYTKVREQKDQIFAQNIIKARLAEEIKAKQAQELKSRKLQQEKRQQEEERTKQFTKEQKYIKKKERYAQQTYQIQAQKKQRQQQQKLKKQEFKNYLNEIRDAQLNNQKHYGSNNEVILQFLQGVKANKYKQVTNQYFSHQNSIQQLQQLQYGFIITRDQAEQFKKALEIDFTFHTPLFKIDVKIDKLEAIISQRNPVTVGVRIETNASFTIVRYEEKNISQLRNAQKSYLHSSLNTQLKNTKVYFIWDEQNKQQFWNKQFFTVNHIKLDQQKHYHSYQKQNVLWNLQRKVQINVQDVVLEGRIKEVIHLKKIISKLTHSQSQSNVSQSQPSFSNSQQIRQPHQNINQAQKIECDSIYLDALRKQWTNKIHPVTKINLHTSQVKVLLTDDSYNQLLLLKIHKNNITLEKDIAYLRLLITPTISLQVKNRRSGHWEPLIQTFLFAVHYQQFSIGRLNRTDLRIDANYSKDQLYSLKINASTQILQTLKAIYEQRQYFDNSNIIVENYTSKLIKVDQHEIGPYNPYGTINQSSAQININEEQQILYEINDKKYRLKYNLYSVVVSPLLDYYIELDSSKQKRLIRFLPKRLLKNGLHNGKTIDIKTYTKESTQTYGQKSSPLSIKQTQIQSGNFYPLSNINQFSISIKNTETQIKSYSQQVRTDELQQKQTIIGAKKNFKVLLYKQIRLNRATIIHLLPPFVIYNCLPKNIDVQFNWKNLRPSSKTIQARGRRYNHANNNIDELELKVKVDGYFWSDALRYSKEYDNIEGQFELTDSQKKDIVLNYNFKKNKYTHQYILTFYCKKYIEYPANQGHLIFQGSLEEKERSQRNSEEFKLIGGYSGWVQSLLGYLFFPKNTVILGSQIGNQIKVQYQNNQISNEAVLKGEKCLFAFDSPIFIGGVGLSQYQVYVNRQKQQNNEYINNFKVIEVLISTQKMIQECDIVTKKIIIKSKKVSLKNGTNKKLFVKQYFQQDQWQQIQSGIEKNINFTHLNSGSKLLICCNKYQVSIDNLYSFSPQGISNPYQQYQIVVQNTSEQRVYKITNNQNFIKQAKRSTIKYNSTPQEQPNLINTPNLQPIKSNIISININTICLSISHNSHLVKQPYQSTVLTIKKFSLVQELTQNREIRLKIDYLQLDQMRHNTTFPVILKSNKKQQFLNSTIIFNKQHKNTIEELSINLTDLDVNLNKQTFYLIFDIYKQIDTLGLKNKTFCRQQQHQDYQNKQNKQNKQLQQNKIKDQDKTLIKLIRISPFTINLSAQSNIRKVNLQNNPLLVILMSSIGAIKRNANQVPITITGLKIDNCQDTKGTIITYILHHYQNVCAKEFYQQFQGLQSSGSRINYLTNISSQFKEVQDKAELEFLKDKQTNENYSEKDKAHQSKGVFGFISKTTDKISDGLAVLAFDKQFQENRDKDMNKKPKNVFQGVGKGGKAVFHGFQQGFTGLFTQPIKGAKNEGALGFFKGAGKGLAGLVVKPITGICDCLSNTAEGISGSINKDDEYVAEDLKTMRYPRVFYTDQSIMRQYQRKDAKLYHVILKHYSQKKLVHPQIVEALEYAQNQVFAILTKSIAFVNLRTQKVEHEIDNSQLKISENKVNKTLSFSKKDSGSLFGCGNGQQYQLYIQDHSRRSRINSTIRAQRKL